ncbi:MAG: RluA family pseudouridine synthase [Balneolaceae bacterium]|nr:RluA family pseudouridine synthase [Balneolaceae bacterium]
MKTTGTDPNIEILFEDNHLLAVNKPAGMLSQEDHTGQPDLLTLCKEYLKQEYNKKGNVFLGLLHRLDKPVSGVMLFAKTSKAASRISEQIRKRSIKKNYHAVVEGESPKNGMLQDYLLKDNQTNTVSIASKNNKRAKKAELYYQREKVENNLSLLNITLITGRPHQIRVQFSHLGYPVCGDQKYGSKHTCNISLHATQLTFSHPTLKKEITIRSKLPTGFPWDFFNKSDSI